MNYCKIGVIWNFAFMISMDVDPLDQVSISSTFYVRCFHTKVFLVAFL